jgi:hypothetical protein
MRAFRMPFEFGNSKKERIAMKKQVSEVETLAQLVLTYFSLSIIV